MQYTISNDQLTVKIDSLGAQLRSIMSSGGREYLWQGDERYWSSSAPVLFPYIGRLYKGEYSYKGHTYRMGIHGFAAHCEFRPEGLKADCVTFTLCQTEETLTQYPFRFRFSVTYALEGAKLKITYAVENRDDKLMPFAFGGHPGFNVPMCEGTSFEDYRLTFGEECEPDRIMFTEMVLVSGEAKRFPLEDGKTLRLSHRLFDDDAIIWQNMAKSVTLSCDKAPVRLTVEYPHMPYLGIWHMPKTDAPYVCIEPWSSLPSRQDVVEEFTCKSDLISLLPGEGCENSWSISIWEG